MSRQNANPAWSAIQNAAYSLVHEFRRCGHSGAEALAPLLGKAPGTLSNEVNPEVPTHKLGLEDAIALEHAANDVRLLHVHAMLLNHACIPIADPGEVSDASLLDSYAAYHARIGETSAAVKRTLEGERIERDEVEQVKRQFFEAQARGFAFITRLEALIDD